LKEGSEPLYGVRKQRTLSIHAEHLFRVATAAEGPQPRAASSSHN